MKVTIIGLFISCLLLSTGCVAQKDSAVYSLIFDRIKADSVNFYLGETNSLKSEYKRLDLGNIEIYDMNQRFKPDQKWISFLSDLDTTNIRSRSLKGYIRLTNNYDSIKFNNGQQRRLFLAPIIYSKDGEKAFTVTTMMSKSNGGSLMWLFENNSGNWKIIYRQMFLLMD